MPEPEIDFEQDWNIRRGYPHLVYYVHAGDDLDKVYVAELECHGEWRNNRGLEHWRVSFRRLIFAADNAQPGWLNNGGRNNLLKDRVAATPEDAIIEARGAIQEHIQEANRQIERLRTQRENIDLSIQDFEAKIQGVRYPAPEDFEND